MMKMKISSQLNKMVEELDYHGLVSMNFLHENYLKAGQPTIIWFVELTIIPKERGVLSIDAV
jgi:hypothetical protein